jgi:hypothetical protein
MLEEDHEFLGLLFEKGSEFVTGYLKDLYTAFGDYGGASRACLDYRLLAEISSGFEESDTELFFLSVFGIYAYVAAEQTEEGRSGLAFPDYYFTAFE